jgi:hypothetical protein
MLQAPSQGPQAVARCELQGMSALGLQQRERVGAAASVAAVRPGRASQSSHSCMPPRYLPSAASSGASGILETPFKLSVVSRVRCCSALVSVRSSAS